MGAVRALLNLPAAERRDETYDALLLYAEIAGAVNKKPLAVEQLQRAVQLRPNRSEARVRLLYLASERDGGSGAQLRLLLREHPAHPDVLSVRASELFRVHSKAPRGSAQRAEAFEEAESLLRRAIARREAPGFLIGLGFVLQAQGRQDEAKQVRLRALEVSRERGPTAYWLREGFLARRKFETKQDQEAFKLARAALLRASSRDPENPAVQGQLAILRWAAGPRRPGGKPGYREVRKSLQEAKDRCPVDWEVNFYLGHTLRFSPKHQAAAIRAFDRAIEFKPGHPWSYLGRGMTYLGQGKKREAAADARKALELKPGWKSAQDLLAKAQR